MKKHTKKKVHEVNWRRWQLGVIASILVVFVVAVFMWKPWQLATTVRPNVCEDSNASLKTLLPPTPPSYTTDEWTVWKESAGDATFEEIAIVMVKMRGSELTVLADTGQYLRDNPVPMVEMSMPYPMAVLVDKQEDKLVLGVDGSKIEYMTHAQIALLLVNNVAGYHQDLNGQLQELLEDGLTKDAAIEQLAVVAMDQHEVECANARAYALEIAGYYQFQYWGYYLDEFSESALTYLKENDWNWNQQGWLDLLGPDKLKPSLPDA